MNRAFRRATRKLAPQLSVLWVPEAPGYLAGFCPHSFRTVPFAELALHYVEDEASGAALAFQQVTGLRVVVRPYYGKRDGSCIGCSDDARAEPLLAA